MEEFWRQILWKYDYNQMHWNSAVYEVGQLSVSAPAYVIQPGVPNTSNPTCTCLAKDKYAQVHCSTIIHLTKSAIRYNKRNKL